MSTMVMVGGIAMIFLAIATALGALALSPRQHGVSRSIEVLEALTAAPKEMKSELDAPFNDRVLVPLLTRAQGLGRRLTPADASVRIHEKLELAGNPSGWSADRVAAGKVIGFFAALLLSLVFCLLLGIPFLPTLAIVVIVSIAGYMAPNMYLYQRSYDRSAVMQKSLPDAIDLLTISVESGLGFDAAVAQVARNTEGPLAEEFARMLQEMQIGRGRTEALRSLAERTNLPDLRAFVSSMVQADAFGIPIGQVLRVQSSEIRVKKRQWAEEQAQKVPVKILVPMIFCILPCLFIVVLGPAGLTIWSNLGSRF